MRDVPVVGIASLVPVGGTVRRSSAFSWLSYQSATGAAIEDELIRALETDDQVTGKKSRKLWRRTGSFCGALLRVYIYFEISRNGENDNNPLQQAS